MGESDEYGFQPGEVTWDDIASIRLVNNGEVVVKVQPDDVYETLRKSGLV
jgi:2',3'-cyclic-nucleotide 2'-phosphodiesterase (5'-nucleotidase family)